METNPQNPFSTRGDTATQKKLRLMRVKVLIKENVPICLNSMKAIIQLEEGLSEPMAQNYIAILFYNNIIDVSNEGEKLITMKGVDNNSNEESP